MEKLTKTEFEIIEGKFHDGLGTFAEQCVANELIKLSECGQSFFETEISCRKMQEAISSLPENDSHSAIFQREITSIQTGAKNAARILIDKIKPAQIQAIRHTPKDFEGAKAGDLVLELIEHPPVSISVKTDKSGKVAIADGQTPEVHKKWAERFFNVSEAEFQEIMTKLGFLTIDELKTHYLNVARFVAEILIRKLGLENYSLTDFSQAQITDIKAVQFLFRQLLKFKSGTDESHVLILDRTTGQPKWETLLDSIDIDALTAERISMRPSKPKKGKVIGSEFALKVDGNAVVTFQIKHKRGKSRTTNRRTEFNDITTRLMI